MARFCNGTISVDDHQVRSAFKMATKAVACFTNLDAAKIGSSVRAMNMLTARANVGSVTSSDDVRSVDYSSDDSPSTTPTILRIKREEQSRSPCRPTSPP